MKKRNGFTLVELLAVIVILAIILAIAIPSISTLMNSASKSSLESSAKLVLKGIDYKMLEDSTFDPTSITEANIESTLNLDDSNYKSITVKEINDTLYITIVGKNKWDKLTVSGTKTITNVENTVTTWNGGANAPVLADGMEAVIRSGEDWVGIEESDPDWYNYDTTNKQWANARTEDGSLWVWIPRYVYRIPEANWHTSTAGTIDIQFSKGVDDNWNKASIGAINLDEGAEASKGTWTNHPAFTFGDAELTGIWMSKFEASSSNPAAPAGGANDITLKVKSVPNVASWRASYIGNAFIVSRAMETDTTYGWDGSGSGIDTHLMKNTEWGALTYLTQSTYGKSAEIWANNSSTFITGCAGSSSTYTLYAGCESTYDTANGQQSSTTGNIYGVYDMVNGARGEQVAAYVDNGNSYVVPYGGVILNADSKYKDIYTVGSTDDRVNNYALMINKKGDAIYETSAAGEGLTTWYNGGSYMSYDMNSFFRRSGYESHDIYNFMGATGKNTAGMGTANFGFRPTLVVGTGL